MGIKKEPIVWNKPTKCGKTPRALLCYLLAFFAMGMFPVASYIPSLPSIQKYFGMSDSMAQATVTVFLISMAAGSLLYGPIAHKLGRKHTIVLACLVFITGSLICLWAPNTTCFLLGRLLQGLGATGLMTLGRTIIRDAFSDRQVATISSYTIPIGPIALIAAPTIGGYFQTWFGWVGSFWFAILAYTLIMLFILFDFPETTPKKHNKSTDHFKAYSALVKNLPFVCFTTCAGLSMGFIMIYQTVTPFLLLGHLALSPIAFGWLGVAACPSVLLAARISHRMTDQWGHTGLLYLGSTLLIISGLWAWITGIFYPLSTFNVLIPFMIGLVGATLSFINGFAAAMSPWPHLASFAAAFYNTWQCTIASIASSIAVFAPDNNQAPMGTAWLGLGLIQMLLIYLSSTKKTS